MSYMKPSTKPWDAAAPGQRLQVCLVQIHITYHTELQAGYTDRDMESVRNVVGNAFHAIAELRGGRLHSWDEQGGVFLFLAEGPDSFDNCCLTAIQMLEMMPSINEDVRTSTEVICPVKVCISCDTGLVAHDSDPSEVSGDFVTKFMRHKRQVGVKDSVTITERVYRQLSRQFKSRFTSLKYSRELEVDLHSTPPFQDDPGLHEPADPPPRREAVEEEPPRPEPGDSKPREGRRASSGRRLRGLVARIGPRRKAAAALSAVFLAGLVIGRVLLPSPQTAAPVVAIAPVVPEAPIAPVWSEPLRSDEWVAWRRHVHEKLSGAKVTEKSLVEALRGMPSTQLASPASSLRRDQEIADVLLNYEGVRSVLWQRFGIDEHFLGTGLSNPVNVSDYRWASVHEYLIPNVRDDDHQVWMRKLKAFPMDMEKTVGQLIEEATEHDAEKQELKKSIVALAQAKEKVKDLPPVIRFARLDEKVYSRRLGRDDRARVFASDLAEIWDLKVKDAAARSGYTFNRGGDTFFVWVFVPVHGDEVIPATWGEVLKKLPMWLEGFETKAP